MKRPVIPTHILIILPIVLSFASMYGVTTIQVQPADLSIDEIRAYQRLTTRSNPFEKLIRDINCDRTLHVGADGAMYVLTNFPGDFTMFRQFEQTIQDHIAAKDPSVTLFENFSEQTISLFKGIEAVRKELERYNRPVCIVL